ncbi:MULTISPECIES: YraN family protein [unclassified Schaalia]|uniref:YraN family protein n=1 Tax=unclassified Schaalia TaxID=2691889 RepID=UPI001E6590AB|nr:MULTISPECIES: YraN family protein [unclassified Schaalia]MCD4549313.1 YraN family protein [Schaalia sp. lx-260]MCD4557122.1 YraN family protein [Schaalia sp. lx-100]
MNVALGRAGEEYASMLLTNAGYEILTRNWYCGRTGEIDIIARDKSLVVIVEVRTRIGNSYGSPLESIDRRKLHRLRVLSTQWLQKTHTYTPARIDVIALTIPREYRSALMAHTCEKNIDLSLFHPHVRWVKGVS